MIVMPAANHNILLGYLAGRFPGRIGTLVSPATKWMKPHTFLPYSLDNGKWADTIAGREWDESGFLKILDKAQESDIPPNWVVVPDALFDRDETLRLYEKWEPRIRSMGFRPAMAVQDGMTPDDVPNDAVAFVGGSERFKLEFYKFVDAYLETHFARVNSLSMLKRLHDEGVSSCDSSGWFRQGGSQTKGQPHWRIDPLIQYLEWSVNPVRENMLFDLGRK